MFSQNEASSTKIYTREDLKKKKKEVADLQAEIEELQIEHYQLKEDLNDKITENMKIKHSKEQIDINKTKNMKLGITNKNLVRNSSI